VSLLLLASLLFLLLSPAAFLHAFIAGVHAIASILLAGIPDIAGEIVILLLFTSCYCWHSYVDGNCCRMPLCNFLVIEISWWINGLTIIGSSHLGN